MREKALLGVLGAVRLVGLSSAQVYGSIPYQGGSSPLPGGPSAGDNGDGSPLPTLTLTIGGLPSNVGGDPFVPTLTSFGPGDPLASGNGVSPPLTTQVTTLTNGLTLTFTVTQHQPTVTIGGSSFPVFTSIPNGLTTPITGFPSAPGPPDLFTSSPSGFDAADPASGVSIGVPPGPFPGIPTIPSPAGPFTTLPFGYGPSSPFAGPGAGGETCPVLSPTTVFITVAPSTLTTVLQTITSIITVPNTASLYLDSSIVGTDLPTVGVPFPFGPSSWSPVRTTTIPCFTNPNFPPWSTDPGTSPGWGYGSNPVPSWWSTADGPITVTIAGIPYSPNTWGPIGVSSSESDLPGAEITSWPWPVSSGGPEVPFATSSLADPEAPCTTTITIPAVSSLGGSPFATGGDPFSTGGGTSPDSSSIPGIATTIVPSIPSFVPSSAQGSSIFSTGTDTFPLTFATGTVSNDPGSVDITLTTGLGSETYFPIVSPTGPGASSIPGVPVPFSPFSISGGPNGPWSSSIPGVAPTSFPGAIPNVPSIPGGLTGSETTCTTDLGFITPIPLGPEPSIPSIPGIPWGPGITPTAFPGAGPNSPASGPEVSGFPSIPTPFSPFPIVNGPSGPGGPNIPGGATVITPIAPSSPGGLPETSSCSTGSIGGEVSGIPFPGSTIIPPVPSSPFSVLGVPSGGNPGGLPFSASLPISGGLLTSPGESTTTGVPLPGIPFTIPAGPSIIPGSPLSPVFSQPSVFTSEPAPGGFGITPSFVPPISPGGVSPGLPTDPGVVPTGVLTGPDSIPSVILTGPDGVPTGVLPVPNSLPSGIPTGPEGFPSGVSITPISATGPEVLPTDPGAVPSGVLTGPVGTPTVFVTVPGGLSYGASTGPQSILTIPGGFPSGIPTSPDGLPTGLFTGPGVVPTNIPTSPGGLPSPIPTVPFVPGGVSSGVLTGPVDFSTIPGLQSGASVIFTPPIDLSTIPPQGSSEQGIPPATIAPQEPWLTGTVPVSPSIGPVPGIFSVGLPSGAPSFPFPIPTATEGAVPGIPTSIPSVSALPISPTVIPPESLAPGGIGQSTLCSESALLSSLTGAGLTSLPTSESAGPVETATTSPKETSTKGPPVTNPPVPTSSMSNIPLPFPTVPPFGNSSVPSLVPSVSSTIDLSVTPTPRLIAHKGEGSDPDIPLTPLEIPLTPIAIPTFSDGGYDFAGPPLSPLPTTLSIVVPPSDFTTSDSRDSSSLDCGDAPDIGNFTFNLKDLPPLTIDPNTGDVQPTAMLSPYHRFWFSPGFEVLPSPQDSAGPSSENRMLQFEPSIASNGVEPGVAKISVGPQKSTACFQFNFYSSNIGCKSDGPDCVFNFTGIGYDYKSEQEGRVVSQTLHIPACHSQEDCKLAPTEVDGFEHLTSILISMTVNGEEGPWWMDTLSLGWSDNACATATCRSTVRDTVQTREWNIANRKTALRRRVLGPF